jgi:hypothetical protein
MCQTNKIQLFDLSICQFFIFRDGYEVKAARLQIKKIDYIFS